MTRRPTKWWSGVVANTGGFIKNPDGTRAVDLLTEWWIAGEGVLGGRSAEIDHGAKTARVRYRQAEFYKMLAMHDYPELSDRDERCLDTVHGAFLQWAASKKALRLVGKIELDDQARQQIGRAADGDDVSTGEYFDVSNGLQAGIHDQVHHTVHDQVHHAVHAQVHHAVSHAVDSGAHGGGGHGGGGHGGH